MNFDRRQILQLGLGACFTATMTRFNGLSPAMAEDAREKMKITKFTVKVGELEKPFTAVHVSDTHLTFADERETERKQKLAADRLKYFGDSEKFLLASLEYAREKNAIFLHTGDLIDFVSEKNFEYVHNFYSNVESQPELQSAGNHEFSHYLGEAKEDEAYKALSYDRVQRAFPDNLKFCSRIHNGVNFVAFDNVYYYVADDLLERMKAEVAKGYPIVTLCHVPFYTPGLYKFMLEERKERCAWVTGVPEEAVKAYNQEKYRYQFGNEATHRFVEWLREQRLVKALLCGHLHVDYEDQFSETARQYVVGGQFKGNLFEYSFE